MQSFILSEEDTALYASLPWDASWYDMVNKQDPATYKFT